MCIRDRLSPTSLDLFLQTLELGVYALHQPLSGSRPDTQPENGKGRHNGRTKAKPIQYIYYLGGQETHLGLPLSSGKIVLVMVSHPLERTYCEGRLVGVKKFV